MNIKQAKQIPIEAFLQQLGQQSPRSQGDSIWYNSPLRCEATPSFKVNRALNAWYDFGIGKGGDIIDLAKAIHNTTSIAEALAFIDLTMGTAPVPAKAYSPPDKRVEPAAFEITQVKPVSSRMLQSYLKEREISKRTYNQFLKEIHYKRDNSAYFGLGFGNDSGGMEIRSPFFKGSLGPKDLTTLPGRPDRVAVFEGFFDMMSAIELFGVLPNATIIVLNSNALRDKAIARITQLNPETVEVYGDNDASGKELFEHLQSNLPAIEVIDKSSLYQGHNDLNDYLLAVRQMQAKTR